MGDRFSTVELPAFPGDARGLMVPATEQFLNKSMGAGAMMFVLMPDEEAEMLNTQRNLLAVPQWDRPSVQGNGRVLCNVETEPGHDPSPRLAKPAHAWGAPEEAHSPGTQEAGIRVAGGVTTVELVPDSARTEERRLSLSLQ